MLFQPPLNFFGGGIFFAVGGGSIFLLISGGEPFFSQCDIVFKSANHIINATSLRFGETEIID